MSKGQGFEINFGSIRVSELLLQFFITVWRYVVIENFSIIMLYSIFFSEQESPKEHPTEMCPSTSPWTSPPRRTSKHPQTRCRTVQQSSTPRLQSQTPICHECRSQKDTRNQGRTRLCAGWIHQHNQQLLPRGNCQVCIVIPCKLYFYYSLFVWLKVP